VAGRIRDEDIALVRERSAIEDVIGERVALRSAGGGNLKGLCPFHDEKSPSFNVTPARGLFHCFGCAVGGDVIAFVQRTDGLSFAEAVERLADRAGIRLRYEQGGAAPSRPQGQRTRLVEANRLAAAFYADQLDSTAEAQQARDFLTGRGFDQAAAGTYGCGYAPSAWDALTGHLLDRGFSQAELVAAGLAKQTGRGSLIDRFHRRLLWPIKDVSGDVVGFGARRLFDDDRIEAKYLNTPDTPLYHKSQVLYGADLAKKEIARRRQAVVVEGYTDVMACHLAGVPTAVATCGTAFGAEHIGVLRRLMLDHEFGGEMIFVFDGDDAGQRAALRAFDEDQRFLIETFVAVEESGLDPCDLRLAKGDTAVRDLVARRQPAVAFALRAQLRDFDLDTAEGRVRALDKAAPMVARIKDRALRPEYARRLAGQLGMEVEPVLARVMELAGDPRPSGRRAPVRPNPNDPAVAVEREVLKLAVQEPQLAGPVFDAIDESAFREPGYAAIRRAIAGAGGATRARSGAEWVERISEYCPDLVTKSTLTELAVERLRKQAGQQIEWYVATQLSALQERQVSRQIKVLRSKLQRINPQEEPDKHARLFGELVALEQFGRGLREQALGAQ